MIAPDLESSAAAAPAGRVLVVDDQRNMRVTTAIVLRQAGVYPLETYSEARLREFEETDRLTAAEKARLKRKLKSTR